METKLWRNPEARREVVAQAMDYGSSLSKWNYEKLDAAARIYTAAYEGGTLSLAEWVEKRLGPIEHGRAAFEEAVIKNLRLGRFLTVIVGDKVRQPVVEMVRYVANRYPGLAMGVALIELQCFWTEERGVWPLLVVPRVVARTEIVERSVVEVRVMQGEPPQVDVRQERAVAEEGKRKGKVTSLSEEAFWESLKENGPQAYEKARRLINEFEASDLIEVKLEGTSITFKAKIPGTGLLASLFFITRESILRVWRTTLTNQLSRAGLDENLAELYAERLKDILNTSKSGTEMFGRVAEIDVERFKAIVDELVKLIQLAGAEL